LTKKYQIAKLLLGMTYQELCEVASDLANMQDEDGGVGWKPHKAYGKYGLMEMLHSWGGVRNRGRMRPRYYRLNEDHSVTPLPDGDEGMLEWARRFENSNRRVAEDQIGNKWVSTVFLGMDHGWEGGPLWIFETIVFEGDNEIDIWRYSTWDQAMEGHSAACAGATSGLSRKQLEEARKIIEALVDRKEC